MFTSAPFPLRKKTLHLWSPSDPDVYDLLFTHRMNINYCNQPVCVCAVWDKPQISLNFLNRQFCMLTLPDKTVPNQHNFLLWNIHKARYFEECASRSRTTLDLIDCIDKKIYIFFLNIVFHLTLDSLKIFNVMANIQLVKFSPDICKLGYFTLN